MKNVLLIMAFFYSLPTFSFATTLNLECKYSTVYTNKILTNSQKYVALHPKESSATYDEAQFVLSNNKKNMSQVQLSIDTLNNKVVDNLSGGVAFNDDYLRLTEYTDMIFIEYTHKKQSAKDKDYLAERIIINRKTGDFSGERYASYRGLNEFFFPQGELVYSMIGHCKSLKRLF